MGGSSNKESNRANDLARQERERAAAQAEALRQQQEAAATQLMREVQQVTAPTTLEADRTARIQTLEPEVQQLLQAISQGGSPVPTELGRALESRLLSDLNRNPDDTFAPNLQLLQGEVGKFASRRGIVGSGLEFEQLGRTGLELAIQQAQARETLRQQQVQQAITGQQSLEQIGGQRRGEISTYLQNLQALEDARRGRQVSAVSGAASGGATLRSQGNLGAIDRLNQGDVRAGQYETDQLTADRAARASQQKGIGNLAGSAAARATMFIPGVGPVLAPYVYSGISGNQMQFPGIPGQTPAPTLPTGQQQRAAQRLPVTARGGYLDPFSELTNSTWGR